MASPLAWLVMRNHAGIITHTSVLCRLSTPPRLLQPPYKAGTPSFLLLGGLVLTPVTVPYLELSYGRDWPSKAPAALRDLLSQWPKQPGEEVSEVS